MSSEIPGGTHPRADVLAEEYRGRYLWDELDKAKARTADLEEQLQAAERKVEAYDRARSGVKIEGNTRAEYVLRIEALVEQLASAQEALRKIVKLGGQGYALSAADVARDALAQNPSSGALSTAGSMSAPEASSPATEPES